MPVASPPVAPTAVVVAIMAACFLWEAPPPFKSPSGPTLGSLPPSLEKTSVSEPVMASLWPGQFNGVKDQGQIAAFSTPSGGLHLGNMPVNPRAFGQNVLVLDRHGIKQGGQDPIAGVGSLGAD